MNTFKKMLQPRALAILFMFAVTGGNGWISSAYQNIADGAGVSYEQVTYIFGSLTSIMMLVCSLLCGTVAGKHISYKALASVGMVAYTVCGFLPALIPTWTVIAVCRVIWGGACGIATVLCRALSMYYYEKDEVAELNGWGTSLNKVATTFIPLLAGALCVMNWRYSFFTYLIAALPTILVLVFLPVDEKLGAASGESKQKKSLLPKLSLAGWLLASIPFVAYMAYLPSVYNMSAIVVGGGLGDAVAAGFCMTLCNVVGIVIGLILGRMDKLLGRFLLPFQFIFIVIGMLLIGFGKSIMPIYIGCFVSGIGFPTTNAAVTALASRYLGKEETGMFSGVLAAMISLGATVCPFYMTFLAKITGNPSKQVPFVAGAIIFFVMGLVIMLLTGMKEKKNTKA